MSGKKSTPRNVLATNRKARRNYTILDRFEAGLSLQGTEVKSIREGNVSLDESFAVVERGNIELHNMHVQPYRHGNRFNHDPVRPRRLLLHRSEIDRIIGQVAEKGHTLVPLNLHLRHGYIKVELGLCRGKQQEDKREDLKKRTAQREADRAMAEARKR